MKRILCIDGGGIKGVFPAQFLSEIEESLDGLICDYFDMIAGTSTGAIIAAGLALGIPAKEICNLYLQNAGIIFPQNNKIPRVIRQLFASKYDATQLSKTLESVFGNATVGDCKTRLLIPAYNITTDKVQVFKTPHHADYMTDYKRRIVDVLLATTAAPTYLPPHITDYGTFVDGGVGANNPSLLAIEESIGSRCAWELKDIYLLSIGCTKAISVSKIGRTTLGAKDVRKILNLFMNAESQYSDNAAKILLASGQYYRINPIDNTNEARLDNSKRDMLNNLVAKGKHEAQEQIPKLKPAFFEKKIVGYTRAYK